MDAQIRTLIIKRLIQILVYFTLMGVILFLGAGTWAWMEAWLYLGLYLVMLVANSFLLLRRNPELIAERAGVKEGTKSWDRILIVVFSLSSVFVLIIAALDKRFSWSPQISLAVVIIAILALIGSFSLSCWAMVVNAFFSGTVRIQEERGHVVVTDGPYRAIRHPGYSAWILSNIALPLLLGSLWAYVPACVGIVSMIIRAVLEEQALEDDLPGYKEYKNTTRYRIVPYLW